jgi:hypothetical protein
VHPKASYQIMPAPELEAPLAILLPGSNMVARRRIGELKKAGVFLLVFGITAPLIHGTVALLLASGSVLISAAIMSRPLQRSP